MTRDQCVAGTANIVGKSMSVGELLDYSDLLTIVQTVW